jgi:hypothetical protein
LAPRVVPLLPIVMSAIGAEPNMRHYLALADRDATDRLCCKSHREEAVEFKFETIESGRAHF